MVLRLLLPQLLRIHLLKFRNMLWQQIKIQCIVAGRQVELIILLTHFHCLHGVEDQDCYNQEDRASLHYSQG